MFKNQNDGATLKWGIESSVKQASWKPGRRRHFVFSQQGLAFFDMQPEVAGISLTGHDKCCETTNFHKRQIFVNCNYSWFLNTKFRKRGPSTDQNICEISISNDRFS